MGPCPIFIMKKGECFMKKRITEEDENQLYYKICSIARVCKKYFFERKYLPSDSWSIDDVVNNILVASSALEKKYHEVKNIK